MVMTMNEVEQEQELVANLITYLIEDLNELIPEQQELDINDNFYDYLSGVIERSQNVLRRLGVPDYLIPSDGSC